MGGRIIVFGVLINLLLMPLYAQMEQRSRDGRELRDRVAREVERMKRHFRGRERYFYIRAVYRQFNYHPISHLLGSADLFVQILVFATVYRFLSTDAGIGGHADGFADVAPEGANAHDQRDNRVEERGVGLRPDGNPLRRAGAGDGKMRLDLHALHAALARVGVPLHSAHAA